MSIGKIIKTGLAIYGGTVLVKKIGRYLFVKNKDKIAAWCKNKIVESCDKAFDEIFNTEKEEPYDFRPWDVDFSVADEAYDARQQMINLIHEKGKATVGDLKYLAGMLVNDRDADYGWYDPDMFEAAPIDRFKKFDGYVYSITIEPPIKL